MPFSFLYCNGQDFLEMLNRNGEGEDILFSLPNGIGKISSIPPLSMMLAVDVFHECLVFFYSWFAVFILRVLNCQVPPTAISINNHMAFLLCSVKVGNYNYFQMLNQSYIPGRSPTWLQYILFCLFLS